MPILAPFALAKPSPGPDVDLEAWAQMFILSPASTDRDRRERRMVAQLLADVEAGR